MTFTVYEMIHRGYLTEASQIICVPFEERYFQNYMAIYNACFYDMRKALEIKPYEFLHSYEQIREKTKDIYVLLEEDEIIGSVVCYGNEADDLIVNPRFQRRGYGKQLLLWEMEHIRRSGYDEISLHVAEWNQNALQMYQRAGFEICKTETIMR